MAPGLAVCGELEAPHKYQREGHILCSRSLGQTDLTPNISRRVQQPPRKHSPAAVYVKPCKCTPARRFLLR